MVRVIATTRAHARTNTDRGLIVRDGFAARIRTMEDDDRAQCCTSPPSDNAARRRIRRTTIVSLFRRRFRTTLIEHVRRASRVILLYYMRSARACYFNYYNDFVFTIFQSNKLTKGLRLAILPSRFSYFRRFKCYRTTGRHPLNGGWGWWAADKNAVAPRASSVPTDD